MNLTPKDPDHVESKLVFSEIEATVIKADGTRVPLGVVSYHHRNPLRRLAYRIKRRFNKRENL